MNNGDVIVFNSKKNFTYVKPLGGGGTGDTHLFLDETTGIQFAIKKYVPKDHEIMILDLFFLSIVAISFQSCNPKHCFLQNRGVNFVENEFSLSCISD